MKNEKMSAEERLKSYLECESILNEFFSKVDYCTRFCSLIVLNSLEDDEKTGCCSYGCYDLFKRVSLKDASLLRTERNDKYGVPDRKDLSRCFYHTEKGCVLNEYKSPVCISAICKDMKEYLAGEFGVEYQVYDVETGMEGILSGLMKVEDIEKFKTKLKSYLSKVSEKLC